MVAQECMGHATCSHLDHSYRAYLHSLCPDQREVSIAPLSRKRTNVEFCNATSTFDRSQAARNLRRRKTESNMSRVQQVPVRPKQVALGESASKGESPSPLVVVYLRSRDKEFSDSVSHSSLEPLSGRRLRRWCSVKTLQVLHPVLRAPHLDKMDPICKADTHRDSGKR